MQTSILSNWTTRSLAGSQTECAGAEQQSHWLIWASLMVNLENFGVLGFRLEPEGSTYSANQAGQMLQGQQQPEKSMAGAWNTAAGPG